MNSQTFQCQSLVGPCTAINHREMLNIEIFKFCKQDLFIYLILSTNNKTSWTHSGEKYEKNEKCYLTQYLITNLSKLNDLPLLHLHPPSGNYDRRPSSFLKSSSLPKPFSQYYEWEHKYEHFLKISSSLTAIFSPAEFLFLVSGLHGKWAPFWNFNFTWIVVQIERFTELWINAYITITHI